MISPKISSHVTGTIILNLLNANLNMDLSLGYYHHSISNFHYYDSLQERVDRILKNNDVNSIYPFRKCSVKLPFTSDIENKIKNLFSDLINLLLNIKGNIEYSIYIDKLNGIFKSKYKLKIRDNLVYSYALVLVTQLYYSKNNINVKTTIAKYINEYIDEDLKASLRSCKYTCKSISKII